ncbi:hypothetical protein, partial [Bradyrhizobium sp.]|uniref:hypothetical protein n=1 Tax=Bradyrhizobium sp. TaxID=376 RepID=UPI003C25BEA4
MASTPHHFRTAIPAPAFGPNLTTIAVTAENPAGISRRQSQGRIGSDASAADSTQMTMAALPD